MQMVKLALDDRPLPATLFGAIPTSVFVATTLEGLTSFFSSQQCKKCM